MAKPDDDRWQRIARALAGPASAAQHVYPETKAAQKRNLEGVFGGNPSSILDRFL